MSVSPEAFCTPAVFALVANVFHICGTWLASMTADTLETAPESRGKTEVNAP